MIAKKASLIRLLASCFLMLVCTVSKASPAVDTLLDQFNKQPTPQSANQFFSKLMKEGLIEEPITFSPQAHADTLRQQVWYWAAEYFYDQQDYENAEKYGIKALPLCQADSNREMEGDCLNILAITYVRKGNFDKAAYYAKLCNELDIQRGDPDYISSSLNTLAAIYMSNHQPKEAEKYILKGIEYSQKTDNRQRQAVLYGMASEVYHYLKQEECALDYATKAYEMEQQLGRKDKAAIRQAQRAAALITLHRNNEAKSALEEAIPQFRIDGNRHSLGIACNQMGLLLHQEQNDTAAVRFFNEALEIFVEQGDLFNESHSHQGLYNALRQSNPTLAMEHNDRYNELRDSLYDRETGELLSKYAAEYDNYQLLQENADVKSAHKRVIILSIVIIIAIVLACWFITIKLRRRAQQHTEQLMHRIDELTKEYEQLRSQQAAESPATEDADTADDELNEQDRLFLMNTIKVINEGLATGHYDLESIAPQLNMSISTFRRRLQAITGETPKAYISAIQMQKAGTLLTSRSDLTIADIAKQCGFEEASSFTRAFKRAYGVAPSQYSH